MQRTSLRSPLIPRLDRRRRGISRAERIVPVWNTSRAGTPRDAVNGEARIRANDFQASSPLRQIRVAHATYSSTPSRLKHDPLSRPTRLAASAFAATSPLVLGPCFLSLPPLAQRRAVLSASSASSHLSQPCRHRVLRHFISLYRAAPFQFRVQARRGLSKLSGILGSAGSRPSLKRTAAVQPRHAADSLRSPLMPDVRPLPERSQPVATHPDQSRVSARDSR